MLRIGSKISKWKNEKYIKCRSWWSLTTLYSKFFSFQVIKWVIWPSLTKVKALVFRNTHFDRTLDGLEWKSHEHQYCSTHQNLHFIYIPFLHLRKFWEGVVENPQLTHIVSYSLCEIQDLVGIVNLNFLKWKNCVYKKFRFWWYLTTWYSKFFHFN